MSAVRPAPVSTRFDGGNLSLIDLSSDEAVLIGRQVQKCSPNSGEASVHKQMRMLDAPATYLG